MIAPTTATSCSCAAREQAPSRRSPLARMNDPAFQGLLMCGDLGAGSRGRAPWTGASRGGCRWTARVGDADPHRSATMQRRLAQAAAP